MANKFSKKPAGRTQGKYFKGKTENSNRMAARQEMTAAKGKRFKAM